MASITVHCPSCHSAQVYRHGQNPNGHHRFRSQDCHRVFQLTYSYETRKPRVKKQITENITLVRKTLYQKTLQEIQLLGGDKFYRCIKNIFFISSSLTKFCWIIGNHAVLTGSVALVM